MEHLLLSGYPGRGYSWEVRGELWEETKNAAIPWLRASQEERVVSKTLSWRRDWLRQFGQSG